MDHLSTGALKTSYSKQVYQPNLDQFSGQYRDLAAANPYANVEYKKSWWQKFLGSLGFATNYDRYLEQMNLQAREYENNLLLKQRDESYNSPLEQAKREREAGLNPNLTGNVGPGDSVPMPDDGNPPVMPETDWNSVQSFASGVLQAVQVAFGLAGNVQGFIGTSLSNKAQRLANNKSMIGFVDDAMNHIFSAEWSPEDGPNWQDVNNYYDVLKHTYGKMMSRKEFKQFVTMGNKFATSLATDRQRQALQKGRSDDRKAFYQTISDDSSYSEVDTVMYEVSKVLGNLSTELLTSRQKAQVAAYNNEEVYQQNRVPSEEAALDLESSRQSNHLNQQAASMNEESLDTVRYQRLLRSSFKDLLTRLDKLSDKGNTFATIAKAVASAMLMGYIGVPSFSFSSGSGPKGDKRSMSFGF